MSHAKPHDERAGHRAAPAVLDGGTLVAPPIPEHLALPEDLVVRWLGMWTSPVAAVLDPVSDLEPVSRLFELYVLDRTMSRAVKTQLDWLAAGDGDLPFDPQFARVRLAVAAEVRQLEQTLGITPRGRLVIGAAVAAATQRGTQQEAHDDADD